MRPITIALLLTVAAACDDPAAHPAYVGATSIPEAGSDAIAVDGGGEPDAPAIDASAPDAAPPSPHGVCDPTRTFSNPTKLSVSTNVNEAMPSVTSDALTLAWITPSDGVVHYADRATVGSAFTPAQALPGPLLAAGERVALGSGGLVLYGVRADRLALVAFTRASTDDAFGAATTTLLENLDAELGAGEFFSDVVVGTSGLALVYRRVGGANPGIRLATRVLPSDAWATSTGFAAQVELGAVGPKTRRPTGLSNDHRALFYFDEVTGHEAIAFFDWDATIATTFVDLGTRLGAQPTGDCSAIYYESASDLWVAAGP